ncbi:MAG: ABC transporter permease [Deltaproteobacteria bacterium]|nr:ABC transporter permease [Deltaproteobacteria bacterium]
MNTWLLDFRLAWRSLRRSPVFSLVAVVTLALGIGFNTALFSLLHSVLINPLPYPEADRLAMIWNELGEGGAQSLPAVSSADFRDYQVLSETFQEFAAASGSNAVGLNGILTGDGRPEKVDLSPVTANFFSLFGVSPALGRQFSAEEEAFQGPKVAVLSHQLWQRRYGSDPELLGSSIEIDGLAHEVVGILPESFRLLLPAEAFLLKHSDVWVPLQVDPSRQRPRNFTTFSVFGRLKPDVSFEAAQREMNDIAAHLRATHPVHTASHLKIRAVPLQEDIVKGIRPALVALMGAVSFVLLIVCANVGSLLLVRGIGRQRELSVQMALGAGFGRLMRRLLAESLLLASLGGLLAVGVAKAGLAALRSLPSADLPRLAEVEIDGTVLAFTAATAFVTAIVFGLLPAWQGARADGAAAFGSGSRASSGRSQTRLRSALVIAEVGICLVLLIGVGSMIQSFRSLQQVEPGFRPQGVLTFRVELPRSEYPSFRECEAFFDLLEESLLGLPGVEAVGRGSKLPLSGSGPLQPYAYDEATARAWESVTADGRWISPGYFDAMGTRVLSGRPLQESDRERARKETLLVIDEVVARRAFPDGNAVGQRLQVEPTSSDNPFGEVLAVVEHVRSHDLARPMWGQIYRPGWGGRGMTLVVRTTGDPEVLKRPVDLLVRSLDPGLPVIDSKLMTTYVDEALGPVRFSLLLMSLFGVLALILVTMGVYGVVSYGVGARLREFAIRLALGEDPGRLSRRVLAQGMKLVLIACFLGLAASWFLARYLDDLLFQMDPRDPLTMAGGALLLFAVALLASYLPARRAGRVEPASLLQQE